MNDKITLPSLVNLLAEKSGMSKKQCEDFVREFFGSIVSIVSEGENLKIKGFGTFKIIDIEPRKSVNVNTGEEIEIPSHRKLTFIPCKELAEEINAPFSMFDTIEIDESEINLNLLSENPADSASLQEYKLEEGDDETDDATSDENEDNLTEDAPIKTATVKIEEEKFKVESIEENAEEIVEEIAENPVEEDSEHIEQEATEDTPENEAENPIERASENEAESTVEETTEDVVENAEPVGNAEEVLENTETLEISKESTNPIEGNFHPTVPHTLPPKRSKFGWGFLCGIITAAALCAAFFLLPLDKMHQFKQELINGKTAPSIPADSAKTLQKEPTVVVVTDSSKTTSQVEQKVSQADKSGIAPTAASDDKVIYDTVTTTHYLTTIAKEHYGNFNLWPYIYEENKGILGHPDRIRPGTRVVIPPLSKYGVDPSRPADIAKAKALGTKIYDKFR